MSDEFQAFRTAPWGLTDERSWSVRRAHIFSQPAGEVNRVVRRLRTETSEHIPWIDPFCGGEDARVLFVAKRPGPLGAMASDFLSLANADQTAKNTITAMRYAGLKYADMVFWNAVPWSGPRTELITRSMLERGEAMLRLLLTVLPRLGTVILAGESAHAMGEVVSRRPNLRVFRCAHTSPLAWNRTRHQQGILAAFHGAAQAADP
jgi:hypothetical protein